MTAIGLLNGERNSEGFPPFRWGVDLTSVFDPSDFRRLRLHEAIFKGFDGESVIIGPAKIYLKPYWKERGASPIFRRREGEEAAVSHRGAVFGFS